MPRKEIIGLEDVAYFGGGFSKSELIISGFSVNPKVV